MMASPLQFSLNKLFVHIETFPSLVINICILKYYNNTIINKQPTSCLGIHLGRVKKNIGMRLSCIII